MKIKNIIIYLQDYMNKNGEDVEITSILMMKKCCGEGDKLIDKIEIAFEDGMETDELA